MTTTQTPPKESTMNEKNTPDEECAQCGHLDTAWHRLANHPALRPPHWEPGNGQSYAEAVLAHLNSLGDEDDRPWEPLGQEDPLHAGDEVWREWRGVGTRGIVYAQRFDSQVYTAERGHLGHRGIGTWYVRRTRWTCTDDTWTAENLKEDA